MKGDPGTSMRPRRLGIADVARAAGVSVATASRVASGSPYPVSDAKRRRVEEAVRQAGYVPDPVARTMATGRARTIGVIVGALSDPYFTEITRGIEGAGRSAGFMTVLCSTDRDPGQERAYLRMLRDHHAAGTVLVGGAFDDEATGTTLAAEASQAVDEGMLVIALAQRPGLGNLPLLAVDDHAMLYDLASELADFGHRRFAFVAPRLGFSSAELRLGGLRAALEDRGLPEPVVYRTGFDFDAGRRAAVRMLHEGLPDAAIGFSDESAIGMLMTFRELGVDVPGQVSIAGVDGTREAEFLGLTTVSVPMYETGVAAAARITGPVQWVVAQRTTIAHRVVPRSTTGRKAVGTNT